MKIRLLLKTDERVALRRLMRQVGTDDPNAAAHILLRDAMIGAGLLEMPHALEEDTPVAGEA